MKAEQPREEVFREWLVALQNADCTTVGGEFDLGEAAADRAKEPFGEFRGDVANAMRIRFQIRLRLVVNGARGGLRLEAKGIIPREMHLDTAFAALHRINSGADEIAVIENITGHGKQADTRDPWLHHLGIAAHRIEIQFSRALRTHQRSAGSSYYDVARNFPQVNVTGNALQRHAAHALLAIDHTPLVSTLHPALLWNGQLKIGFEFIIGSSGVHDRRGYIHALTGLFRIDVDFVGGLRCRHDDLGTLPRLDLDSAIRIVLNHINLPAFHRKMPFKVLGDRKSTRLNSSHT